MGRKHKNKDSGKRAADDAEEEGGFKIVLKLGGDQRKSQPPPSEGSDDEDPRDTNTVIKLKLQPSSPSAKRKGSPIDGGSRAGKRSRAVSPSPGPASPRPGTLTAPGSMASLVRPQELFKSTLSSLHKVITIKDTYKFFAMPVNDSIAPNYSSIIKHPMDLSTMAKKVEDGEYADFDAYLADFELMCNNAMTYNDDKTVYFKAAAKLLKQGGKIISKEKTQYQKTLVKLAKQKPSDRRSPLAMEDDVDVMSTVDTPANAMDMETESIAEIRLPSRSEAGTDTEADGRPKKRRRARSLSRRDSTAQEAEAVVRQVQEKAEEAAQAVGRTAERPHKLVLDERGNLVFDPAVRKAHLNFLTNERTVAMPGEPTLGDEVELPSFVVRASKSEPTLLSVSSLLVGPYASNLPQYDAARAQMTREQEELVSHVFGDAQGYAYARSKLEMAREVGKRSVQYVDAFLQSLTDGRYKPTEWPEIDIKSEIAKLSGDDAEPVTAEELKALDELRELGVNILPTEMLASPRDANKRLKPKSMQEVLDDTAGLLWELERVQRKRVLTNATQAAYAPEERAVAEEIVWRLKTLLPKMPPEGVLSGAAARGAVTQQQAATPTPTPTTSSPAGGVPASQAASTPVPQT